MDSFGVQSTTEINSCSRSVCLSPLYYLPQDKIKNSAHRALTVLGLICENHAFPVSAATWGDEIQNDDAQLLPGDELSWENFTLACYRLFSLYLQKTDSGTKCKALAALKGIFVAHPQLLLCMDHVGLFDEVMDDAAGIPLQLEALECWRNILMVGTVRCSFCLSVCLWSC